MLSEVMRNRNKCRAEKRLQMRSLYRGKTNWLWSELTALGLKGENGQFNVRLQHKLSMSPPFTVGYTCILFTDAAIVASCHEAYPVFDFDEPEGQKELGNLGLSLVLYYQRDADTASDPVLRSIWLPWNAKARFLHLLPTNLSRAWDC